MPTNLKYRPRGHARCVCMRRRYGLCQITLDVCFFGVAWTLGPLGVEGPESPEPPVCVTGRVEVEDDSGNVVRPSPKRKHLTTSEQFLTTCPQQSSYDVVRRITHLQRYKQSFLTCRTSSDSFRSRYSLDRVFSVVSSFSCFKIARDYSMSYAVVGPNTMSRASPLRDNL